jgi:hypothetical protein
MISKIQPLRQVEEILVWKNKKSCYYPQKIGTDPQKSTYMTKSDYFGEDRRNKTCTTNYGKYRNHFISLKRDIQEYSTRPQELVELMIKSYSKEGDTILDCFCYKGLSYKCSAGRKWIGIAGTQASLICDDFLRPWDIEKPRFWVHGSDGKARSEQAGVGISQEAQLVRSLSSCTFEESLEALSLAIETQSILSRIDADLRR